MTKGVAEGLSDDEARGLCAALVAAGYGSDPERPDGSTDDAARYGTLDPAELTRHYVAGRGAHGPEGLYGCADTAQHRSGLHNVYVEARKAAYRALLRQHGEGIERSEAERGRLEAEVERLRDAWGEAMPLVERIGSNWSEDPRGDADRAVAIMREALKAGEVKP